MSDQTNKTSYLASVIFTIIKFVIKLVIKIITTLLNTALDELDRNSIGVESGPVRIRPHGISKQVPLDTKHKSNLNVQIPNKKLYPSAVRPRSSSLKRALNTKSTHIPKNRPRSSSLPPVRRTGIRISDSKALPKTRQIIEHYGDTMVVNKSTLNNPNSKGSHKYNIIGKKLDEIWKNKSKSKNESIPLICSDCLPKINKNTVKINESLKKIFESNKSVPINNTKKVIQSKGSPLNTELDYAINNIADQISKYMKTDMDDTEKQHKNYEQYMKIQSQYENKKSLQPIKSKPISLLHNNIDMTTIINRDDDDKYEEQLITLANNINKKVFTKK